LNKHIQQHPQKFVVAKPQTKIPGISRMPSKETGALIFCGKFQWAKCTSLPELSVMILLELRKKLALLCDIDASGSYVGQ
jgi:hypothetical protein